MIVLKKILVVFLFLLTRVAVVHAQGFVTQDFTKLETEIRTQYTLEDIAQKLTEVDKQDSWPESLTPAYRLYIAINWLNQNQSLAAANLLQKIVVDPSWDDLRKYHLAMALMNLSRYREASLQVNDLAGRYASDPDAMYLTGLYLTATGDLENALVIMDKLVKISPNNGRAYLQRGILRMVSLSHDLAVEDFKKAANNLPKTDTYHRQQAYLQAGVVYFKFLNDHKKADKFFKLGINIDPDSDLVTQLKDVLR